MQRDVEVVVNAHCCLPPLRLLFDRKPTSNAICRHRDVTHDVIGAPVRTDIHNRWRIQG